MSKHLCECSECGDEHPFRALIHSDLFPGFLCPKCKELEDRQIDNTELEKEHYEKTDDDNSSSTGTPE